MAFIDEQFPLSIAHGSSGGPAYQTAIISMRSGEEKRNINWQYPRHEYDAATGVKELADLEDLIAFFHVVQGRGHEFRWKDFADYKSCKTGSTPTAHDQSVGTGDGVTTEFQLKKYYNFAGYQRYRYITKPVDGTVSVAVDGTIVSNYTVNTTTGKITFSPSTWAIVDIGLSAGYVAVEGDKTGDISVGDTFEIINHSSNEGLYTVASTNYDSVNGRTEIYIDACEAASGCSELTDDTIDGSVRYGQPSLGAVITAGYEFDVHARLDTDQLSTNLSHYQSGDVEVPVIEIKEETI